MDRVSKLLGLVCAIGVGLFNGSLMVPFHYFKEDQPSGDPHSNAAIAYLASFSFGVMMVTAVCFLVFAAWKACTDSFPDFHFRVAGVPGFITGLWLNVFVPFWFFVLFFLANDVFCVGRYLLGMRQFLCNLCHTVSWRHAWYCSLFFFSSLFFSFFHGSVHTYIYAFTLFEQQQQQQSDSSPCTLQATR